MYNLTIVNNYAFPVTVQAETSHTVQPNDTFRTPQALGNAYVTVPGIGQMLFKDIADTDEGGFSKATWGVYLAYQGEEVVFRYEGGGDITVTLDGLGQAQLSGNGGFSSVRRGAFKLPGQ